MLCLCYWYILQKSLKCYCAKMKINKLYFLIFVMAISCQDKTKNYNNETSKGDIEELYQPHDYVNLNHPDWSKNVALYQLNTRQFTKDGTFKSAQKQKRLSLVWITGLIILLLIIHFLVPFLEPFSVQHSSSLGKILLYPTAPNIWTI